MDTTEFLNIDVLIVCALLVSSFLLGCMRRLICHLVEQKFDVARSGADLREQLERADEQQNRVRRIQDELDSLKAKIEQVPSATAVIPAQPQQRVSDRPDPSKLARAGADVETIMARCKLSRAEAELVWSVYADNGLDRAA